MSRIFVKNLPKKVKDDELKKHFSSLGEITDFKLLYKEDGKFRRTAILGFRNADAAEKALKLYNKTYYQTSQIEIEEAKSRGQIEREKKITEEERTNKFKERQERREKAQGGGNTVLNKLLTAGGDLLSEYLNINTQKSWSDAPILDKKDLAKVNDIEDNSNKPKMVINQDAKKVNILTAGLNNKNGHINEDREVDPSKIKISGLPAGFTEEELTTSFSKYGDVKDAICCIDPLTKIPTGIGYVTFSLPEQAVKAFKENNIDSDSLEEIHETEKSAEIVLAGKMCRMWPACVPKSLIDNDDAAINRIKKEYRAKGRDVSNKLTWNSTMQRSDTVAGVVAERLDLSKAEVAGNAVGLAIAEATLATEAVTKLKEECGVDLTESDPTSTRSKTVILAKNLPKGLSAVLDIRPLFENYGRVLTCVIPIDGFAVITMAEPSDARRAYNKLAFHRVGVEKAPMFLEFAKMIDIDVNNVVNIQTGDENEEEENSEPIRSIYVKNIAFTTSTEEVKKICMKIPGCVSVTMQASNIGHKGYGWMEFKTPSEAKAAVKILNKITKDGFKWSASVSDNNTMGSRKTIIINKDKGSKNENENENKNNNDENEDDEKKITTPKLLIKNIPFQSSAKELKELFSQFGRLQRFTVPKKFDGGLRGFGFVEYASIEEAQKAYDMAKSIHFYGRHLVIQESNDYINRN